jgi:hypothetical protein
MLPELEAKAQAKARATAKPFAAGYAAVAMDTEKHDADARAKVEAKEYYTAHSAAMKLHWDQVIVNKERDKIHSATIALNIFPEVDPVRMPHPAKKQWGEPRSVTTTKATEAHRERAASPVGEKRKLDAPAVPALPALAVPTPAPLACPDQAAKDDPEPSSCLPKAKEDVPMRVLSLPPPELDASHLSDAHMDPHTRGTASSIHCPANAMEDDDVVAVSGIGLSNAMDDGAAPLSTASPPPVHRPLDSTQDQATGAAWMILSKKVDKRCADMESKMEAAIAHLASLITGVLPPAVAQPPAPGAPPPHLAPPTRPLLPDRLRRKACPRPALHRRMLLLRPPKWHPPPHLLPNRPPESMTNHPSPLWSKRVSG